MMPRPKTFRRLANAATAVCAGVASLVGVFVMLWILYEVMARGLKAINFSFFTKLPTPPGIPGGGVANAVVGTLLITLLASGIAIPVGLLGGTYLAEFGRRSRPAAVVRFLNNILMGTPSIIIGVFAYTLIVLPARSFSGYAGAAALAFIMLPVVTRTAEDMLNLVPNELRESALALGAPRWKATMTVVFRSARTGLVTGALLAVARVSGETAPLLFTALNSPYWMSGLGHPTANLTVTIFNYAMSPFADWQQIAWGASLVIISAVLALNLVSRFLFRTGAK